MWEITILIAFIIYIVSVVVFIDELIKESRSWEETLSSKASILFFGIVSLIPIMNTVIAVKSYRYRINEEKENQQWESFTEENKRNSNELN
tara:strand:+ start:1995 stop:2267 length:273 start_codon:yes stop_codon:yes gene_type:complete